MRPGLDAILAVGLAALLLGGCGASDSPGGSASSAGSAGAPGTSDPSVLAPSEPPSPVTGVVVAIESSGLESVTGFTLRSDSGLRLNFRIAAPLENAADFPLGHLGSHVASSEPVRVWFRRTGGALVVYRIEDVP